MAKQESTIAPLLPALEHGATTPLHRQLFEALREAVLDGRLAEGSRLPSTRDLARELGLSRNTVLTAYDQLTAEGFLEGRTGAGTWVSAPRMVTRIHGRSASCDSVCRSSNPTGLSRRGELLASTLASEGRLRRGRARPFRSGVPSLDDFPSDIWARLSARRWRRGAADLLGYGDPAGYRPLRESIAAYLRLSRGVRCTADQVIVVSGSQQGMDLTARLLLDPGDMAWVEQPGYAGVRAALLGAGVRTVPVSVDAEGMDADAGIRMAPDARLACVTPSHQYPVGVTMSLPRRMALLDWAARAGGWILEDDYDAEFRYSGRPLEAMQGLDTTGRVVYLGTFSKVLAPALRLGYLVVPDELVDAFTNARDVTGRHAAMVEQAILTDFMVEGHFARHLRRMRSRYAERQAALVEAATDLAGGLIDVRPAEAGMHVVGWLPRDVSADIVARRAGERDVDVYPFTTRDSDGMERSALMLGYAPYEPDEIRDAMAALTKAIRLSINP